MKRWLTLERLWIALPFSFVLWAGLHAPIRLLDFWWHLKLGEVIAHAREIPAVDLFSYTAAGEPFVAQSWLAELIYFGIYALGGVRWLIAVNALLLVTAFLFVWFRCRAEAASVRVAVAASMIAVAGLVLFRNMRPQVFSFVLFALFLWVLRRENERRVWIAPLAMLLWVNLHGAFVLGIALCLLTLLARPSLRMAVIALLTTAATFVSPYGARIWQSVVDVRRSHGLVWEWLPPRLEDWQTWLTFFLPLVVTGTVLVASRRRLEPAHVLYLLAFAAFGFTARRNGIWFSLVAAPVVASQLRLPDRASAEYRSLNYIVAVMMIVVTVVISPWATPRLLDRNTPVGLMEFIARQQLRGRIFHPQEYGDYLIWRLWPRQRSFIDGRVHLFDETVVRDYRRMSYGLDVEALLRKYDIRIVIVRKEQAGLLRELRRSTAWGKLYEDRKDVVFVRRIEWPARLDSNQRPTA